MIKTSILSPVDRRTRPQFSIRRTENIRDPDWLSLRSAFWDGESEEEHHASLKKFTSTHAPYFAFIANDRDGGAVGFAEISVRNDYVNGTESSPVLYLEGIYVVPDHRGEGISRALCGAAEDWGVRQGIREFASDADIDNEVSIRAHLRLGFEETDRVVCFRKVIGTAPAGETLPGESEEHHGE